MTDIEIILVTILVTSILLGMFGGSLSAVEDRFVRWASALTSTRRWFTTWILVFPLWVVARQMLLSYTRWYTLDFDNIVLAALFSAIPFFIENLLKSTTTAQMQSIQDQTAHIAQQNEAIVALTTAVRTQLDLGAERDDLLHEMVARLLDALEQNRTVIDLANTIRSYLTKPNADTDPYLRLIVSQLLDEIDKGAQP